MRIKLFKNLAKILSVLCVASSALTAQQGPQTSHGEQSEIVQRILKRLELYDEAQLRDNGRRLALNATLYATENLPSRSDEPSRRVEYQVGTFGDVPVFVPFEIPETLEDNQAGAVLQEVVSAGDFKDFLGSRMGRSITQYQACDSQRVCVKYCKRKDGTKYCCKYECQ